MLIRRLEVANVALVMALSVGCGDSPPEGVDRSQLKDQSVNAGVKETDLSALLKKGMTPEAVIDELQVTHFSVGPVMNLGTEHIRYRTKAVPKKVLDAEFSVLTTGKSLAIWKFTDEEDYDDWLPIEAATTGDSVPPKE